MCVVCSLDGAGSAPPASRAGDEQAAHGELSLDFFLQFPDRNGRLRAASDRNTAGLSRPHHAAEEVVDLRCFLGRRRRPFRLLSLLLSHPFGLAGEADAPLAAGLICINVVVALPQ